jgi:DNA helicase-2/ATP-dependent DNA helicase PcrA
MDEWRDGGAAAAEGWEEAGVRPRGKAGAAPEPVPPTAGGDGLAVGVFVHHERFGVGRVTDLSGHGALRRAKIRFAAGGEKTLVLQHAKLTVLRRG